MKSEGELGVLCHKFWTDWKPLNTVKDKNVNFPLEKKIDWGTWDEWIGRASVDME